MEWATQSCLLSFNTIGVWPETIDGTDLNCCAKSNDQKLVATGDDFGKIKLYTYPVTQPKVRMMAFEIFKYLFSNSEKSENIPKSTSSTFYFSEFVSC